MLKTSHGKGTVEKELAILKLLQGVKSKHLPELVWDPDNGRELGIVPVGNLIDFQ